MNVNVSSQSVWTALAVIIAAVAQFLGLSHAQGDALIQAAGLVVGANVVGLHVRKASASSSSSASNPPAAR